MPFILFQLGNPHIILVTSLSWDALLPKQVNCHMKVSVMTVLALKLDVGEILDFHHFQNVK